MATFRKDFIQDLRKDMRVRNGGAILYTGNENANTLTVTLFDNGEAYSGGGTVTGTAIRHDGRTVPLTGGTLTGNVVSITLNKECYNVPGPLGVYVDVVTADATTTVLSVIYCVVDTETDTVVDPSGEITISVNTLINQINQAIATVPAVADQLMAALAPTYDQITFPIDAGMQHCWYNGKLWVNTVDIAASETWISSHWQETDVDTSLADLKDGLGDLKSAFDNSTGNGAISMVRGKFYSTSSNVIDISMMVTSARYECALIPCTEGDQFTINGNGTNTEKIWVFVNSEGALLASSGASTEISDVVITAPQNTAYLVLNNSDFTKKSYYGMPIKDLISFNNRNVGHDLERLDEDTKGLKLLLDNTYTAPVELNRNRRYNASGASFNVAYMCSNVFYPGLYKFISLLDGSDFTYSVWRYVSESSGEVIINDTVSSSPIINLSNNFVVCIRKMSGTLIDDEDICFIKSHFSVAYYEQQKQTYRENVIDVEKTIDSVSAIQEEVFGSVDLLLGFKIGRYDTNGYTYNTRFAVATEKCGSGNYVITSTLPDGYQYAVFNYVSDSQGTVLLSYNVTAERSFTCAGLAVVVVRKMDADFDFSEMAEIKSQISVKKVIPTADNKPYEDENLLYSASLNVRSGTAKMHDGILKATTGSGALSDLRFTLPTGVNTSGVPTVDIDVFKPSSSSGNVITCEILGTNCQRSKPLTNGWNHIVFDLYSGDISTWPGTGIRLYTACNEYYLKSLTLNKQEHAYLIMIEDGGYPHFYVDGAYNQLKSIGVPVTLALDPYLVETGVISQELIDQLAVDPYTEFSVHAWTSSIPTSTMSKDELMTENNKAFYWLRKRGLLPQKIWRAAWTQNTAPYASSCFGMLDGAAASDGTSAALYAFPFENVYSIPRYSLHGRSADALDDVFDKMQKTHCTLVCYTHDVSETGDYNMRPDMFAHFLEKIQTGVSEGWLAPTTFSRLMILHENGLA